MKMLWRTAYLVGFGFTLAVPSLASAYPVEWCTAPATEFNPGDIVSDASLTLVIEAGVEGGSLTTALRANEPFVQLPVPLGGEAAVELLDAADGVLYRGPLAAPAIANATVIDDDIVRAVPNTTLLVSVPDLVGVHAARLFMRGSDMPDLSVDIDLGKLEERIVDMDESPSDLEIRLIAGSEVKRSENIDVVLVAEGYTAAEKEAFFQMATGYTEYLLTLEPWSRYANRFNFTAIWRESLESGVSIVGGVTRDTAYGMLFQQSSARFPVNRSDVVPLMLADGAWARADFVVALVNHEFAIGPGITDMETYAIVAGNHADKKHVFKHEMEHWGRNEHEDECAPPGAPNVTNHPTCNGWYDWLGIQGVSCVPAAWGCSQWRATDDCGMSNFNFKPVCPICREALTVRILQAAPNARRVGPQSAVDVPQGSIQLFEVAVKSADSIVSWFLDDAFVGQGTKLNYLNPLDPGMEATVRAEVIDPTEWIRDPIRDNGFKRETITWTLRAMPAVP